MSLLCRLGIHHWSNWTMPRKVKVNGDYGAYDGRCQERICLRCNKGQERVW